MVSIHRPLGYGPSTLPLRHSADLSMWRVLLCIYNVTQLMHKLSSVQCWKKNALQSSKGCYCNQGYLL